MVCPRCRATMSQEVLAGTIGQDITIDLCLPCQVFWFDTHESLQLSPGAVLKLFQIIGDRALSPRPALTSQPLCPRCNIHLVLTHDIQRNTKFQYQRCPWDHGRLISFIDFLREKGGVKDEGGDLRSNGRSLRAFPDQPTQHRVSAESPGRRLSFHSQPSVADSAGAAGGHAAGNNLSPG